MHIGVRMTGHCFMEKTIKIEVEGEPQLKHTLQLIAAEHSLCVWL
jgi:hypothetical protein